MNANRRMAIVVELQSEMETAARAAWEKLAENISVRFISSRSPAPHITLQSNLHGRRDEVVEIMEGVASQFRSFAICGNGLGVFVDETPVVHIRWRLCHVLLDLKKALDDALDHAAHQQPIKGYARDDNWLAKTTLAFKDSSYENLFQILQIIKPLDFRQNMIVNGISLYEYSLETREKKIAYCRFNESDRFGID